MATNNILACAALKLWVYIEKDIAVFKYLAKIKTDKTLIKVTELIKFLSKKLVTINSDKKYRPIPIRRPIQAKANKKFTTIL